MVPILDFFFFGSTKVETVLYLFVIGSLDFLQNCKTILRRPRRMKLVEVVVCVVSDKKSSDLLFIVSCYYCY